MKLVRVRLRQPHMQVPRATAVDLGASIPGTLNMRGGYQTSTTKQPTLSGAGVCRCASFGTKLMLQ
jgi:hypothetical protein